MSTIEITFTGLCLFVMKDENTLKVLMPGHGSGPAAHTPRMEKPDGTGEHDITGHDVDLSQLVIPNPLGDAEIPHFALPVDDIAARRLKPGLLDGALPAVLDARMTLPRPTIIAPDETALWQVGSTARYLTNELKCIFENVNTTSVTVPIGNPPYEFPEDAEHFIRISFSHTPRPDPFPGQRPQAHHVHAFYGLLQPGGTHHIPRLREWPPRMIKAHSADAFIRRSNEVGRLTDARPGEDEGVKALQKLFDAMSTYTCLAGTASPG